MVPMRRVHREIQDPDAIHALIDACQTVRIGATDDHGPFVVPMSFGTQHNYHRIAHKSTGICAAAIENGRPSGTSSVPTHAMPPISMRDASSCAMFCRWTSRS